LYINVLAFCVKKQRAFFMYGTVFSIKEGDRRLSGKALL